MRAKLQPPLQAEGIAVRARIVDMFAAASAPRSILLSGPAGYGKTTAMLQWLLHARAKGDSVAWLALDRSDGDGKSFVAYLVGALVQGGLPFKDLLPAARAKLIGTSEQAVLDIILERLSNLQSRVTMFIDDVQAIRDTPASALLESLVRQAPPDFHVIMASRVRLSFSTSRMKLSGHLREISAHELRFGHDECRDHFGFDAHTTALVMERCDGWPVAVKMTELWLKNHPGQKLNVLELMSVRSGDFADYLTEQVLDALPAGLRSILLRISILNRFDGDLVNAVCEREDGWKVVEEIRSRGLFLTVTEDEILSFSIHALFRSFMHERLLREARGTVSGLHIAASRWLFSAGHLGEAVSHACQSNDPNFLASFLDNAGGWSLALSTGVHGLDALRDWPIERLEALPPQVGFITAYLLLQHGELERGRTVADRVVARMDETASPLTRLSADVLQSIFDLYDDKALDPDKVASMRLRAVALAGSKPLLGICIEALNCYAAYHWADFRRAIAIGQSAITLCAAHGGFYASTYIHAFVGLSFQSLGRLEEAQETLREARRLTAQHYGSQSAQAAMIEVLLANVLYERGDVESARMLLDESFSRACAGGLWFDMLAAAYSTLSGIALKDGVVEPTLDLLELAQLRATERAHTLFAGTLMALRVRLLTRIGSKDAAAKIVETPEFARLLTLDVAVDPPTWRVVEPVRHAFALYQIATGTPELAIPGLQQAVRRAEAAGAVRPMIDYSILLGAAHAACGEAAIAHGIIAGVIRAAAARGFRRSLVDTSWLIAPVVSQLLQGHKDMTPALVTFATELFTETASQPDDMSAIEESLADGLSRREGEVLRLLAVGMSSKEMAVTLSIAESTVKVHRKRLYRKLNAGGRYAALKFARERGLLATLTLPEP